MAVLHPAHYVKMVQCLIFRELIHVRLALSLRLLFMTPKRGTKIHDPTQSSDVPIIANN